MNKMHIDDEKVLAFAEWFGGGSDRQALEGIILYRHPHKRREYVVHSYNRHGTHPELELYFGHYFMDNDLLGAIAKYQSLHIEKKNAHDLLNELRIDGKEPLS